MENLHWAAADALHSQRATNYFDGYIFCIPPRPAMRVTRKTIFAKDKRGEQARAYKSYKEALQYIAKSMGYSLPENGILNLTFVIPIPKCKEDRIGKPHTFKPDIDNLVKAFMDAMADGKGDARIHTITAKKVWGTYGEIQVHE